MYIKHIKIRQVVITSYSVEVVIIQAKKTFSGWEKGDSQITLGDRTWSDTCIKSFL